MRISRDELFQRAGVENFEELELKHTDLSEVLEKAVMDRVKTIETGKDYFISINLETNENCCTVNFKDERPVIELRGDRFGVYFPNLSPEEVCDMYRNGDYAVNPEARHLIKELVKDFQHQELLRTQAAMLVPEH